MIKVYGNLTCPDCVRCKESFEKNGISFEFIDVTGGYFEFKSFLRLRDTEKVFDEVKAKGKIGIPAIVTEDGSVFLDVDEFLAKKGYHAAAPAKGNSCDITGKGC